ncbi:SWI6 [Sanghuangporus weigelae]
MQNTTQQRPPNQPTSVKIYNAVYSSVQVYECMVRGIAVMRRRADSYVNATQILKVAGVDKGRRTKILEKEVLPGKHEIVQGGYGKYQGTWIPLERGRELALQYGIAPLLSPLFDFQPTQQTMGGLPSSLPGLPGLTGGRPLSGSATYPNLAPITPGSALRLLNQGRAQGLFTPSTSSLLARSGLAGNSNNVYIPGLLPGFPSQTPSANTTPKPNMSLKRTRTDSEIDFHPSSSDNQNGDKGAQSGSQVQVLDFTLEDVPRPSTSAPPDARANGIDEPSPAKRARTDPPPPSTQLELNSHIQAAIQSMTNSRAFSSTPQPHPNGLLRSDSSLSIVSGSRTANGTSSSMYPVRQATKPPYPRSGDKLEPLKNPRRSAIMTAICQGDNPGRIIDPIKEASSSSAQDQGGGQRVDFDLIIDDLGHSPLHLAASLAHLETVKALVANGADIYRGNYQGETPLMRSVLSTHNYDVQSFPALLEILHPSIRTIDTAKRTVLHHAVLTAGVKGRAPHARYYLEGVLSWIAQRENAFFRSVVDLQDEHGDTALNIAARVGNKGLVRTLLDVGANRLLPNKLGLRPGDFGVEPELSSGPKAEDLVSALRTAPSAPVQKSQDVIADLTAMIQNLSAEFAAEIKSKQDAFDVTNAHVRAATRELAEQRKQIEFWKQRRGELDQVLQRIRNTEKALKAEDHVDWTGRTEANGKSAGPEVHRAFAYRGPQSTLTGMGPLDLSNVPDSEPPLPETDSLANLIKMRRMKLYEDRIAKLLQDRLQSLQGASAEKEYQSKRIVAMCTGIPVDKVEDMLDDLLLAVESESQVIDIGRVSGFMQKVNEIR